MPVRIAVLEGYPGRQRSKRRRSGGGRTAQQRKFASVARDCAVRVRKGEYSKITSCVKDRYHKR